jgi:hypothetical protein
MAELLGDLVVGDLEEGDHICVYVGGPGSVALEGGG